MLIKSDLEKIERLLDKKLDEKLEAKLNEKLSFFPTKEEFFNSMDKIMGELQAIREEMLIGSHRISDHEDRIIVLEQKAGIATV